MKRLLIVASLLVSTAPLSAQAQHKKERLLIAEI
jgi:hypothetical protein